MAGADLEYIFHPRSVAVAGASNDPQKQGYAYMEQLLEYRFSGPIYPVTPKAQEVLGVRAYPSLKDIPGPVDYIISCIPAPLMPRLMEECGEKGVKVAQLFTARFSETGDPEGAKLEREMAEIARRVGVRIIGPNCMGIYYPRVGLSFKMNFPKEPGPVAFISQSGGNAVDLVYRGSLRGLRFSKVISYGNGCDLNESDFLEYLTQDQETKIICAYIEGVKDGRRFLRAVREAAQRKPLILLKGGRTEAGTRAVASHTGSLAGSETLWEALSRQIGVIRVANLEEASDILLAFQFLPPGRGRSAGVVGGGGGGTVQAADDCEGAGLKVFPLPPDIREELKRIAPELWNWVGNPIDMSIMGGAGPMVGDIISLVAHHPLTEVMIANAAEDWFLDTPEGVARFEEIIDQYIKIAKSTGKPTAFVFGPADAREEWRWKAVISQQEKCYREGFPVYPNLRRAARAVSRFLQYHEDQNA